MIKCGTKTEGDDGMAVGNGNAADSQAMLIKDYVTIYGIQHGRLVLPLRMPF